MGLFGKKSSGGGTKWHNIIIIIMILILFLYLASKFFVNEEFAIPAGEDMDVTILMSLQILLYGALLIGAYAAFIKLSGESMSKKDVFSLVIIGIIIFLMWGSVIAPILGASTLSELAEGFAKTTGILIP